MRKDVIPQRDDILVLYSKGVYFVETSMLGDKCYKRSNTNVPALREAGEFPRDVGTGIGHKHLFKQYSLF